MKYLILICSLVLSYTSLAQKNTQGLYLGFSPVAGNVYYDDENLSNKDNISGADLRIGYGITKTTTLFLGIGGYEAEGQEEDFFRENYTVGLFELGSKFHLGKKTKSPVFYLEAALQGAVADYSNEFNFKMSGAGLGLGGGVLFYIGDVFAIDLGLHGSWGSINSVEVKNISTNIKEEGFGVCMTKCTKRQPL